MQSLYLLIPIAMVIIAVAVAIFFWAVKSGQYDDLDTEASRILFDEPASEPGQSAAGDHAAVVASHSAIKPSQPASDVSSS